MRTTIGIGDEYGNEDMIDMYILILIPISNLKN